MPSFINDTYRSCTDNMLSELLRNGDEAAFTALYDKYHGPVYSYLLGFVKQSFLAEDLVHEAFMKLWVTRGQLVIKTSFQAYLYRICHNVAIDALKKITLDNKLRHGIMQSMDSHAADTESTWSGTSGYEQLIDEAVALLPPQRLKVFLLCRKEGMTYDKAARELGISRNTIKEHMVLSLRAIRLYLARKRKIVILLLLFKDLF